MTARALFSLNELIFERFRELVPSRERSQTVERFMRDEIARREQAREAEIERLATMVENDSDAAFAAVRGVTGDVDAVAGSALE